MNRSRTYVVACCVLLAVMLVPAVALGATRVEQTDSRLYWHGAWFRIDNASLSAGNMAKSVTLGSSANISFKGTAVDYVALKSPRYGIAKVTLDEGIPTLVDLYDPGSQWRTKVWSASGLSDTTHTVSVEFTGLRNPSAVMAELNVDAFDVEGTVADFSTSTEESDSRLYSEPTWTDVNEAKASNSVLKRTDTSGTSYVSFVGTSLRWVGTKGPDYGNATVRIDSAATQTVDLYAPVETFQTEVWSQSGMTDTTHTAAISWTGTRNAAATGTKVDVDRFSTRGYFAQTISRFETTDARMYFSSDWYTATSSHLSSGSMRKAAEQDCETFITFRGTAADLIGLKTNTYGKARVTLDGGAPEVVDLYAPADVWKTKLWSVTGLSDTTHTVCFEWTGEKNDASSGTAVALDAVDLMGTLVPAQPNRPVFVRHEQDTVGFAYYGPTWSSRGASGASAGSQYRAGTAGDVAYVTFKGTDIKWLGSRGPANGSARVTVDDGDATTVDLYSAAPAWKSKIWTASGMSDTTHTVMIEWSGDRNAGSNGTTMAVDAFDIKGTILAAPVRCEQTDERITRSGTWTTYSNANLSGGSYAYAGSGSNGTMTVRFIGTGIDWVSTKAPNFGIAQVVVDDGTPFDVDLYAPTAVNGAGQHVMRVQGLSYGEHTLTLSSTGRKRAESSGTFVGVDAFDVLGQVSQAPVRYEQNDSRIVFSGLWTTYVHPALSGGSYRHSRPGSGAINIKFNGTGIDYFTSTGPDYGIAKLTLDGGEPIYVDLCNYGTRWSTNQRVWTARALEAGDHTLTVTYTGERAPQSPNAWIGLDAVEVVGTLLQAE